MSKKIDLISSLILFSLGLVIFLKSLTYPIGSFRSPGGGLFPLLGSLCLITLSIIMGIQTFLRTEELKSGKDQFFSSKEAPKRIFLGFLALVGFRYLLPMVGFGPATFLFIFYLTKFLGNYNWKISSIFAGSTAICAYYLFQVWLRIPMPPAILKF